MADHSVSLPNFFEARGSVSVALLPTSDISAGPGGQIKTLPAERGVQISRSLSLLCPMLDLEGDG